MGTSFTWKGVLHAGIASFLQSPIVAPQADTVRAAGATHAIYGIPFDSTTITRTGSMHGPRAVRDASSQFLPYHFDFDYDISESVTLVDCGDAAAVPGSAAKTFQTAEADLSEIINGGAMPIIIGGEHSVTIPGTRSLAAHMEGPLGLVLFDSHMDTAVEMGGEELTHCAPVTRTLDLPQFSAANTVLVGMHGPANPREERRWAEAHGVRMYTVDEIVERGISAVTEEAMARAWEGANGVYVSIDLDCLDAAYVPGTCAPEPGGMTGRELLTAVRIIGKWGFSGLDVVEIAPQYDIGGITARMACRVVLDALASHAIAVRDQKGGLAEAGCGS